MTVDRAPKASRREWIGLAVIALPCLLYSMDLTHPPARALRRLGGRETGASSARTLRRRATHAAAARSARRAVSSGRVFAKLSRFGFRPVSSATSFRLQLSRRSPGAPAVQLGP